MPLGTLFLAPADAGSMEVREASTIVLAGIATNSCIFVSADDASMQNIRCSFREIVMRRRS
jgi:nicotinamidase-related amidase